MKPCISDGEKGLDAMVDPSFGRALYFQFLDTETMTREVIENPAARGDGTPGPGGGRGRCRR